MRYMKVTAQDRSGLDTLHYQFYEDDQLLREATAVDHQRLKVFGKTYLKCAWYNARRVGNGTCGFFRRTPAVMACRKPYGCTFMTDRRLPTRQRSATWITMGFLS